MLLSMKRAIGSPVEFSCHRAARLTIHSRCCQLAFFQCFGRLALEDVRHAEDLLCLPCPTFLTPLAQRMLSELTPATNASKAKALQSHEKYYYVFFLGTLEKARGKGLCSAMVRHYQFIVARDNHPLWMEAGMEYCWRLYERLGFVAVDEIVVGKGRAAADGTQCRGDPGVRIWGMIWRPTPPVQEGRVQCTSREG
jgi:ribosomal protein S18 acetylase RimI-like enzyme